MLPLCVDLDGTLVRTDTLHEQVVRLLREKPATILMLPIWLLAGRASLKRRLSEACSLDPVWLPYHQELIEFLRTQKEQGRRLILATAADAGTANRVAATLELFDEVHASDGVRNLKGSSKSAALVEMFGKGAFAYAGDSRADLAVWREAGAAILVSAPRSVRREVEGSIPVERVFQARRGRLGSLIRAMRIYQWVKNLLVFAPMLLAHSVDRVSVLTGVLMFFAFGLTASGTYLTNDLLDLESDRAHPRKRRRPFASGDLPLTFGLAGLLLMVLGPAIGAFISLESLGLLVLYMLTALAYSAWLKIFPLVDVFILAALYTVRLYSGGVATSTPLSIWLLGFSSFLFLSLAFLKRVGELTSEDRDSIAGDNRRGYTSRDTLLLQIMGVASAFLASLVLSLYVDTDVASEQYAIPVLLWLIVPLYLFWQCRMWLAAARGSMTDDPIVFAAKDRVSWLVVVSTIGVFVVASLGIPGL